jgi:predicted RNA-binding protein with PIN domain
MERADRLTAEVRRLDADLAAALEELGAARADRDDLLGRATSAGRRAQQAEATLGRERTRWRQERARWHEERDSMEVGESAVPSAAGQATGGGDKRTSVDVEAARDAVRAAAEALGLAPVAAPAGANDIRPVPVRRRPLRLGRGIHADSPEGVLALLAQDGIVVFVDGYNVAKRAWPAIAVDLQRKRLVDCLTALCARTGGTVDVIFDGADVNPLPPRSAGEPVRVHFSPPGVEADDEIIDRVAALDPAVPVAVISSDRRVQDGAADHGANVIDADVLISTFR